MIIIDIFGNFFDTSKPCSCINQNVYFDYIEWLGEKDIKDVTIQTRTIAIKSFFNYLIEQKKTEHFKMPVNDPETPIKVIYTDEELERILIKPNLKKCSFVEYRTWVLSNFLLGTGARLNTVINIKISDIDFDTGKVAFRKVKNRHPYFLPLSPTLYDILWEYVEKIKNNSEYLFCSQYGEKLSPRTLEQNISEYNISRRVNKTSIHLYRHTFATKFLAVNGNISDLQKALGHETLFMSLRYAHLNVDDLKDSFVKANPLEQLKIKSNCTPDHKEKKDRIKFN